MKKIKLSLKFLKQVVSEIGMIRTCLYFLFLIVLYSLNSMQPILITMLVSSRAVLNSDSIVIIITLVASFFAIGLVERLNSSFLQNIRYSTKKILWRKVLYRSTDLFREKSAGETLELINEASASARSIQYHGIQALMRLFVSLVVYALSVSAISSFAGLTFFFGYIIFIIFSTWSMRENPALITKALQATGVVNDNLIDNFKNVDIVFAFQALEKEEYRMNNYLDKERQEYLDVQTRLDNLSLYQKTINFVILAIMLTVCYLQKGEIPITIIVVSIYALFTFDGLGKGLVELWEDIHRLSEAIIALSGGERTLIVANNVSNTSFFILAKDLAIGYNDNPILKGINFIVKPGQVVEIRGPNGIGKTTLLRTIAGIIKPLNGKIQIGFLDRIAYVSQDSTLFNRTVIENICYPDEPHDIEGVFELTQRIGLSSLIAQPEDLIKYKPGDFGEKFSGGEIQKVLLARAIISGAKLVILDEILNSLDKESVAWLKYEFRNIFHDRIVFFVSHQDFINADIILNLSEFKD